MIRIGLTGSIGMGKSTASAMLVDMGVPVHDSDEAVRQALATGGAAVAPVAALWPDVLDTENNAINRQKLGDIVFSDPAQRQRLENILHPIVWQTQSDFARGMKASGYKMIAFDIPLLFETGAEKNMDYTICVSAPFFVQKRRVLSRPGMSMEKFSRILDSQMRDAEKRKRADFTVCSGLGRAFMRRQLQKILARLQKQA